MKSNTTKLLIIICSITLFSCSETTSNPINENFINASKEIKTESDENNKKVEELGELISSAINDGSAEGYLSKFDLDYFGNKLSNSMGLSGRKRVDFDKGLKKGISNFPREIITQVNNGSLYDFVNYRYDTAKNAYFMLFRLFSDENGVNYHDYRVSMNGDEMMFNDMYIYLTGENISQTMQRLMLAGMPSNKLLAILNPEKKQDFNKVIKASRLLRSGQYRDAYNTYSSMTSDMKDEKFVLIMKGQVARMYDDDLYQKSMKELMAKHPNDNTLSFNYIDYYLLKEDYQKSLEAVNNLKSETKDDFLEYLIGNINYTKGDLLSAKKNYRYMIENYSDFHTPYFVYMACLAENNEYKEIVEVLNKLQSLDYQKYELSDYLESTEYGVENEFEKFIKSTTYKRWKKK